MNNVDFTKELTHLSLCSGYEGIGIGLRGIFPNCREVAFCERETWAASNLVSKMEEGAIHPAPVYTDLKTFPFADFLGKVDILSGGFPCQPFSHAGLGKGVEDPRHLFPFILAGIKQCLPRFVFLENVEGILSKYTAEGEPVLLYVLKSLEESGYKTTWGIFSAAEVGAPHQRKRVFILGDSNSDEPIKIGGDYGEVSGSPEEEGQEQCPSLPGGTGELADSKHDGLSSNSLRGGVAERGTRKKKGQKESRNTPGAGRSQSRGNLQGREPEELADSISVRPRGGITVGSGGVDREGGETPQEGEAECDLRGEAKRCSGVSRTGLAFAGGIGGEAGLSAEGKRQEGEPEIAYHYCNRPLWPSRPGEAQYSWEEPRVVGDTKGGEDSIREPGNLGEKDEIEIRGEILPDGTSNSGEPVGDTPDERLQEREESKEQKPVSSTEHPDGEPEDGETQSELGGTVNGSPGGLVAVTRRVDAIANRVDRLRLLGNAVIPAVSEKAFRTLYQKLKDDC